MVKSEGLRLPEPAVRDATNVNLLLTAYYGVCQCVCFVGGVSRNEDAEIIESEYYGQV